MKFNIRLLYLYLFSFVGLLITIIGSVQLVDLGIKNYIFKVSEYTYYPEPVTDNKQTLSTEEMPLEILLLPSKAQNLLKEVLNEKK